MNRTWDYGKHKCLNCCNRSVQKRTNRICPVCYGPTVLLDECVVLYCRNKVNYGEGCAACWARAEKRDAERFHDQYEQQLAGMEEMMQEGRD